jgi:hypothetical protein
MTRAGIAALLILTSVTSCKRAPKSQPSPTAAPALDAGQPAPPPSKDIGPFTVAITHQEFGVAVGPLRQVIVTSDGDVTAMSDPPPALATGNATPADLDALRAALASPAFDAAKPTEQMGEGMVSTLTVTTAAGARLLRFGGGIDPGAGPIFEVIHRLQQAAQDQPVPPLDEAVIVLGLQEHGAGLGPLRTVTVTGKDAKVTTSDGKSGRAEVFTFELAAIHMALMNPALATVQSTDPAGESLHRELSITLAGKTQSWHFHRDVPPAAKPLVDTLVAIMTRALKAP